MALNLKTLAVRSLSGSVFVVVLVGSLLWNYYSFSVFFFVTALIGLNEFYKLSEKLEAKPYKAAGFIAAVLTYVSFVNFDFVCNNSQQSNWLPSLIILMPFFVFAVALFSKKPKPIQNTLYTICGIIYSVLPFALLHHIVISKNNLSAEFTYYPHILLGIIFLIWSNDTFAYLGGSIFGRHKMIERISPGKTWEGTIFGVIVTFGISFLIQHYLIGDEGLIWPMLGVLIPILATIGDLVESMLKRQAGIKDSGSIMPGHGGVLDRFDSLIFVSPFVYVLIHFL